MKEQNHKHHQAYHHTNHHDCHHHHKDNNDDSETLILSDNYESTYSYFRDNFSVNTDEMKGLYNDFRLQIFCFCLSIFGFFVSRSSMFVIELIWRSLLISTMGATLISSTIRDRPPTELYSYGYYRFDLLYAFIICIAVAFVCFSVLFHSVHHILGHYFRGPIRGVSIVFLLGFFNLISYYLNGRFIHSYLNKFSLKDDSSKSNKISNINSIIAYLLYDCISILLLLILIHTSHHFDFPFDGLFSLIGATIIIYRVLPISLSTGKSLMQTTPNELSSLIQKCLREIMTTDGVLECSNYHVWLLSPGIYVGSFVVRVNHLIDETDILIKCHSILRNYIQHLTIQIEKDNTIGWINNTDAVNQNETQTDLLTA